MMQRKIGNIEKNPHIEIYKETIMFNPLKMAGDLKGMEKMLKPALEKFMQDSGFIKESEFRKLEKRVEELEEKLKD